jgi:hypothetical protein
MMITPWRAYQATARSRKVMAVGFCSRRAERQVLREDLDIRRRAGQARGAIDADVQVSTADTVIAGDNAETAAAAAVPDARDPVALLQ